MAIKTLQEKFAHELGAIYDAEHQFLEAQQEMLTQATNPTVQQLLAQHIAQTEQQITVLEQVFKEVGETAEREKCAGAAGIVSENQKMLKQVSSSDNPALVDLAIAGGSAKVEHFEIAVYRGLITGAEQMGQTRVVELLRQNLEQEEQTAQQVEQNTPTLFREAMSAERGMSASA